MNAKASQILIEIAKKGEPDAVGLSLEAAGSIPADDKVRHNVLKCLYDLDEDEIRWGLWFCAGLLVAGRCDNKIKSALSERMNFFLKSRNADLRTEAVHVLVVMGKTVTEYRETMLRCLEDDYHGVRRLSLLNCNTFLYAQEIEPLLKFRLDPYYAEASMLGSLVYLLRDEALFQIERILDKKFGGARLSENVGEGKLVQWKDWNPFIKWWESPKQRLFRFFWRNR